jgi:hypothetical protein
LPINRQGIAEGTKGYALVGSSEKTLSGAPAPSERNESRNLFIQIIKKDFQTDYKNPADFKLNLLTKGTDRVVKGKLGNHGGEYFLDSGTVDYGVKWLTNYTGTKDVANPKVVATDDDRFVVMWETFVNWEFKGAYYVILSSYGEVLQPETLMKNTRLSYSERPIFRDGKVYWTVAYGSEIEVYVLDINKKSKS